MVALTSFSLLLAVAPGPATAANQSCGASEEQCLQLTPEQMFALADSLQREGKAAEAIGILQALTRDKNQQFRSEARFRIARLLEEQGDLMGASLALRALLLEEPSANPARLELARILNRMGKTADAKRELSQAEAIGLPPDVALNVRHFAGRLAQATKHRGLTLELTAGPDSNINRSTSSPFIDTIIAPFELSDDARRIGGVGLSGSARGYSRDAIGPINFLSRVNARADLYDKSRFNDIQLSADSGPEFTIGKTRLRPSAIVERRWYGGDLYAKGWGGDLDVLAPLAPKTQIEIRAAAVRQSIVPNPVDDGWRTSIDASLTRILSDRLTGQVSLRHARLKAQDDAESVRSWGGSALLAHEGKKVTLFGEAGITFTHGLQPLFLFGDKRRDTRWDVSAGAIFKTKLGGMQPVVRATYSESQADIVLWDFRRFRLDIGVTRNF